MESPNLYVPFVVWYFYGRRKLRAVNWILMSLFILHYINRSIIYPLRMKAAQPMPASVTFLGFIFCVWNSATQALYLLAVNKFP
jgi:3-oxo-5-alpha-steroid 4-dehydrogenase 1